MKVVTWNVNGIRARELQVVEWLEREKPDVFCLQELKAAPEQLPLSLVAPEGYTTYWHGHKGYSGVGLLLRSETFEGGVAFTHPDFDHETRVVEAHLPDFTVASLYVPNGGKDFAAKLAFLEALERHAAAARAEKRKVLFCGDLNVALTDRDVHPKERKAGAIGQRPDERALVEKILAQGLVDTGRVLDPGTTPCSRGGRRGGSSRSATSAGGLTTSSRAKRSRPPRWRAACTGNSGPAITARCSSSSDERAFRRDARLDSLAMAPPRILVTASPGWEVLAPARTRVRAAESDPFLERILEDGRLALEGVRSARPRRGAPSRPGLLDARVEAPAGTGWVLVARHPSGALTFHAASGIEEGVHRFEVRLAPPPIARRGPGAVLRVFFLRFAGAVAGALLPVLARAWEKRRFAEARVPLGLVRLAAQRGKLVASRVERPSLPRAGDEPALSPRHVLARGRRVRRSRAGRRVRSALGPLRRARLRVQPPDGRTLAPGERDGSPQSGAAAPFPVPLSTS